MGSGASALGTNGYMNGGINAAQGASSSIISETTPYFVEGAVNSGLSAGGNQMLGISSLLAKNVALEQAIGLGSMTASAGPGNSWAPKRSDYPDNPFGDVWYKIDRAMAQMPFGPGGFGMAVEKTAHRVASMAAKRLAFIAAKRGYKTLAELGLKDGMKIAASKALELGQKFLGKGYKELIPGSGRYVSADGRRVFRMGVTDITGAHGGGPHVNFETLIPNPAKPGKMMVDQNIHIYLTP